MTAHFFHKLRSDMKATKNPSTIRMGLAAAVCLAAAIWSPNQAQAAVVVNFTQSGANIVATYSGTLDLSGLTYLGLSTGISAELNPTSGYMTLGSSNLVFSTPVYSGLTGPSSFGTGGFARADSGSGTTSFQISPSNGRLYLSPGYASGSSLSGSSTWNSKTFASLGMTQGTYVYSLKNDSITVNVGPVSSAVPEPSSAGLAAIAIGLAAFQRTTRRRKAA